MYLNHYISYLTVIYSLKYLAYTTLKSSTTVTTFTHMGMYCMLCQSPLLLSSPVADSRSAGTWLGAQITHVALPSAAFSACSRPVNLVSFLRRCSDLCPAPDGMECIGLHVNAVTHPRSLSHYQIQAEAEMCEITRATFKLSSYESCVCVCVRNCIKSECYNIGTSVDIFSVEIFSAHMGDV